MLKARLSSWADCDIWKDPGVFELNKGYLENLLDRLNLYEYGIMVATRDDATKSRGETKMAPRDNVVFELGLFMGRLGRDRTFFCAREGFETTDGPLGITLLRKEGRRDVAMSVHVPASAFLKWRRLRHTFTGCAATTGLPPQHF